MQDQMDIAKEIEDAISRPLFGDFDESELEEELAALQIDDSSPPIKVVLS